MTRNDRLTAAQLILLAGATLTSDGAQDFTEWDLSVAAWKRDPNRFGCRGYEALYPDHKRVMMEIMGKTKKDNPLRRGWMEKAGTNRYRVTPLGRAEADRLAARTHADGMVNRSPAHVYDGIAPYVFHRVFIDYCRDPEEPRTWLGASAFLSLTTNSSLALEDRIRAASNAASQALQWMDETKEDSLRSGPVGGKRTVRRTDVAKLVRFIGELQSRFEAQMNAIRRRG